MNLFRQKAEEIGKVPNSNDIQQDIDLPSYEIFKKELGRIRESVYLKDIVKEFNDLYKKNKNFCKDCVKDPDSCNENLEVCKQDAKLYFEKYDEIY